ncbi:uncharacterized protein LOC117568159 isoform X1 [Drosophila albomicans]|uniref:Uncharacterized protein LOC117568159 isoform X1 n=2 Tax=Drosophila albomicans TaxID=7291 RepID=A0A6P8WPU1_DROAB|nr:uncharacterized protein LOC117568159 isoform X1 [Drosophila albomicans]
MSSVNGRELKHCYRDIFPVFFVDFKKDFDCKDVELPLRDILTKKEVDEIIKSPPKYQIYHLFWTLRNQSIEVVEKFVENEINKADYGFLMSAIKDESCNPSASTENYISERDRLYNDNQKFTKYNVPRIEPYLELQKALLDLRPSRNVAVQGVLGSGKRWLVLDVCSSYEVQRKMDFRIFWLNVRDCRYPENRLEMLQSFLHQIAPSLRINCDQSVAVHIERVKAELRHILKDKPFKNCLLVLLNVPNKETWKAFNLGCKILVTTRHKSVVDYLSPVTTTHISLEDALTPCETESLFGKYLPLVSQEALRDLRNAPKTNPLKLSVIARNIRDGMCTLDNWKNIITSELATIIENSLNELKASDKERFESLFIFPKSAHIPIKLLGLIWSVLDPMTVVNDFYKCSLVEKHSDQTITLSSIYSEFSLPIPNADALNKKIVDFYDIPRLIEQCNDTNLPNLDCYFYSHIGHHLSKVSNKIERVKLFRMIYLDFRFLEQKIRSDRTPWNARGSILHTLNTLKCFRDEIVDNDSHYRDLLNDVLVFLTKAEEKLISSPFTSLLRIALMSEEGPVHDEALRQVRRFPDFVWFTEHGRFHQHREIINLGQHEIRHAVYLDDDYCLMALSSQQLLLTDVSLAGDTTRLLSDENDPSDIIEMRVFNKQLHLLTLHKNGSLKLWSLKELLPPRAECGSCLAVRPPRLAQVPKHSKPHCYEQLVNTAIKRFTGSKFISAFYLDENVRAGDYSIQLHVAFDDGDFCILNWADRDRKFVKSQTPILLTKQKDVRYFSKIFNRFYVVWSDKCNLTFWNLKNASNETEQEYAPPKQKALAMEKYMERLDDGTQYTILMIIYQCSVWRFKFKHAEYVENLNSLEVEALPFSETIPATITCGKLSTDGRYLILGTEEGLVVYDLKYPYSLLRSNVSERIVCVDVYDLNESILKYIVLCGAKGKHFVHVHTLRSKETDTITWMHHVDESDDQLKDRNTMGRAHLYLHPLMERSDDGTVYVVDSRMRIHQIQPLERRSTRRSSVANWSTIVAPHMECGKYITALSVSKDGDIYGGYNNGDIINITKNETLLSDDLKSSVDYLKEIESLKLIASCRDSCQTVIFSLSIPDNRINFDFYTIYARLFHDDFLLLFTDCVVFYMDKSDSINICFEQTYEAFYLKDDILYLAFGDGTLQIYKFYVDKNSLCKKCMCKENLNNPSQIRQLTASDDGELIALGLENGIIELYSYDKHRLQLIYSINQGCDTQCNIRQLRFSPCKQVLISCGKQLCFWSVKYMRNNQAIPEVRSMRHSHYNPPKVQSKGREEVDAARFMDISDEQIVMDQLAPQYELVHAAEDRFSVWAHKRGSDKLPELLACIKFVGNEARRFYTSPDFTQFYVIDNESVFYHLKVLEFHGELKSPTQSLRVLDDVVSARQTEQKEPLDFIDQNNEEDDGVDVVGSGHTLPPIHSDPI